MAAARVRSPMRRSPASVRLAVAALVVLLACTVALMSASASRESSSIDAAAAAAVASEDAMRDLSPAAESRHFYKHGADKQSFYKHKSPGPNANRHFYKHKKPTQSFYSHRKATNTQSFYKHKPGKPSSFYKHNGSPKHGNGHGASKHANGGAQGAGHGRKAAANAGRSGAGAGAGAHAGAGKKQANQGAHAKAKAHAHAKANSGAGHGAGAGKGHGNGKGKHGGAKGVLRKRKLRGAKNVHLKVHEQHVAMEKTAGTNTNIQQLYVRVYGEERGLAGLKQRASAIRASRKDDAAKVSTLLAKLQKCADARAAAPKGKHAAKKSKKQAACAQLLKGLKPWSTKK